MEIEYIELKKYLALGNVLGEFDYLYKHSIGGYPLKKDVDTNDLYLIRNKQNNTLELLGVTSGAIKKINEENLVGNWWILPIPVFLKKELFGFRD